MAAQQTHVDGPTYDVAIVGYGPVGQCLAIMLAMEGHKVCVVERWKSLYHHPRAVHYDHETARIFQHLGVGEGVAQDAFSKISIRYLNADRQVLMKQVSGGDGPSGWPLSNMFYQPHLEATLNRRVGELRNVERRLGWEAIDLVEGGESVTIHVRDLEAGTQDLISAKYVVGCDGANSFVRTFVGEEMEDLDFYFPWLVVSGRMLKGETESWGVQLCDPARPQTYVPVGPHRVRFEFMMMPGESVEEMSTVDTAWRLMKPWGFTPDNVELERHAVYTLGGKWSLNWRRGRLMLAGDAAHQMPPFLGQGMCSGIRDAMSLSWRLSLILKGQAPEKLLDTYTSERVPHIADIVSRAVEIGKVLCITDPEAAKARDAAMLENPVEVPVVLDWRMGPGVFRPDDPSGGLLSPQAVVRREGHELLLDDFTGTGFRMLTVLPEREIKDAPAFDRFEQLGGKVVSLADGYEDVTGSFTTWLNDHDAIAAIVRPDFQTFGVAKNGAEICDLFRHLDSALTD